MKLYHWTKKENIESILKEGLRPSGFGIVYLTPKPETYVGEVCLEVETGNLKLTAFEDCKEWEVLGWGAIPPKDIIVREEQ